MKRIDIDGGTIIVAHISEITDAELWLDDVERRYVEGLRSPTRRDEWMAWRAIVKAELGRSQTINYSADGAPQLVNPSGEIKHISVAHSKGTVAVILSKGRCGLDIESLERDFSTVAERYVSQEDAIMPDCAENLYRAIVWCAKEALYKYGGRAETDFLKDVRITAADSLHRILYAELYGRPTPAVHIEQMDEYVLCYIND